MRGLHTLKVAAALLFAFLGASSVAACSDKTAESEANRAVVSGGSPSGTSVRVEALGVGLVLPEASGWRLLGPADAQNLSANASIAAFGPSGVTATLSATPQFGPSGDDGAEAARRAEVPVDARAGAGPIAIGDNAGLRYRQTSGVLQRAGVVWTTDGVVFHLRVWGPTDAVVDSATDLAGAVLSFERKGEFASTRPDTGADWSVRSGAYHGLVGGITITPPTEMRVVTRDEVEHYAPGADVAWVGRVEPLSIALSSEPTRGPAEANKRVTELAARLGGDARPALTAKFLGTDVRFVTREVGGDIVAWGSLCASETCHLIHVRVGATHPVRTDAKADGDGAAAQVVTRALAGVARLTPAQTSELTEAVTAHAAHRCDVGPSYSVRQGRYRHFGHGVSLGIPVGWRFAVGERASAAVRDAALFVEGRQWGIEAAMVVDSDAGADAGRYHAAVVESLRTEAGMAFAKEAIRKGEKRISEGAGTSLSFVVATQIANGRGVQLLVWGAAAHLQANKKSVDALIDGLSLTVGKESETPPGGYLDRRLGLSATMPVGWRVQDDTPAVLQRSGALMTWQNGGRVVGLVAHCVPEASTITWARRLAEQHLRRGIGARARGAMAQAEQAVAGKAASGATWNAPLEHADVRVLTRGNLLVAIAAHDHNGAAIDLAAKGFSFLD